MVERNKSTSLYKCCNCPILLVTQVGGSGCPPRKQKRFCIIKGTILMRLLRRIPPLPRTILACRFGAILGAGSFIAIQLGKLGIVTVILGAAGVGLCRFLVVTAVS